MKKTVLALLASFLFANASYAQFEGPSSNNPVITVKQALNLSDNARVALRGHITKSLGDEKYTFTDGTAEVMIEIDDEDWGGRKVTPENTVEIFGELDKEMFEPTKVDVDSFNIQ